ncbi:hypothetical protein B0H66DRAFT_529581 [Apodospora peruviana]|uniref:Lytic polysaccharide monooxygenase n=1 Tax=Apodospora peruviana TaxID=516989 RepID=A0AAE0II87_9PEZI|nr:hypothetical protein B0H66DRAFT_529581 [Apodospora peruviana]
MFFRKIALAAGGLAAVTNAHVVMNTPKTFAVPAVHNGPLDASGSDFPCQAANGVYSAQGVSNVMELGSSQPLAFTGSAVHGGGSCQISITYDTAPTKNSVWKVIHSIEGGCPAKNTEGNLGDNAAMPVPFDFTFPIPKDIPAGNGTLAWTWLNRIGNREFYMNCAPVTLTGSGGDKSNWESLPDMFTANIGNDCTTTEKKDYKYPNPGNSVDNFSSFGLSDPVGAGCQKAVAGGGGGSGSGSGGGAAVPPPSPTVAPAPGPTDDLPGGVFITIATDGGAAGAPTVAEPTVAEPTPTVVAPVPSKAASSPPALAPAPPAATTSAAPVAPVVPPVTGGADNSGGPDAGAGSGSGSGSGSDNSGSGGTTGAMAAGSACSPVGLWNCVGGTSYQQCGSGVWSPVMALAAGTSCSPGQSASINIVAANGRKRRGFTFRG